MSENDFPTGTSQALYPYNFSSNHAAAVEMTCNMNLNCFNNQVAGVWPNDQIQKSQPPLPLFPPPQQPPPPPLPYPQENWYNGYSYQHQVNLHRLAPYPTYPPYHFPQYLSQYVPPTSYYSMNQVWQSEINVGTHNTGLANFNANKQGPVKQWPKMSWKIISNSIATQRFGNNKKDLVNNKREKNSLEAHSCKSSTSKLDTALVKAAVSNIGCDENGLVSKSCSNPNLSLKSADAVEASKATSLVCVYCKKEGHRGRNCPIKPCYKCDKVGHRAKKCTESKSASARNLITSNTTTDEWEDYFLKLQPSLTKCVTGANAIPRGSGRPLSTRMSIGEQSTPSSLDSTAPNIVTNDNLNILPNEIPRRPTDSEESTQDDSAPSRKRQRSCDSLLFEENIDGESMKLSNSIKNLPREELEEIIMVRDATIADLKQQLNYSNERVATLECEVNSLNVTKEKRRSVGLQVELTENSTSGPQNNYQAPFIKIERIKKSLSSSRNATSNQEIYHSPPSSVTSIFQTPTANCNISHVDVKTEKL